MQLTPIAEAVHQQRPAVCVFVPNPLDPESITSRTVPAGTRIRDLDPKGRYPSICRLDGGWLLRAGWDQPLLPGQVVEFHQYPQGGGNGNGGGSNVGRTILMIAAIYVAVQFGQGQFATTLFGSSQAATAISIFAATALVNALVPVNTGNNPADAATATSATSYNANLAANQARLEQPIPVLYGRNKTFPDFAAQSYAEYDNQDNQYYNALLCIGQGSYLFESKFIDDTDLNNFDDVDFRVLPPGTLPTLVHANVSNAIEVTGNELVAFEYVGPFVACRSRSKATKISIDVTFSRGLATYDSTGNPGDKSVTWQVEYRAINDFGGPVLTSSPPGAWTVLATQTLTLAQTRTVRRTYTYNLPVACRPQIRIKRTTAFDENSRVANTMEWAGLRCFLEEPATLCPTATYAEVRVRASQQLNGLTQRKIAVITRRKLRKWSPLEGWSEPEETRNPAWALADKWTDQTYGDKYKDSECDLNTIYRLAQTWEDRQDRFDAVFDQTYESQAADQMIASAGRAAVFRRNGMVTVTRDELRDLPRTSFNARNIQPGSVSIDYMFATEATPDGVIVEFWNNRMWDWDDSIVIPCPGVEEPQRPQRLKLFGVTGATHAKREGTYQAYNNFYRRKYPSFKTELEGMLPSFGSAVAFSPAIAGWGRSGDVVSYSSSSKELRVTEPPEWVAGADHYLAFIQRDGFLSVPTLVVPGSDGYTVILKTAPAEDLSFDSASEERTKYVFGVGAAYETIMRVLHIGSSTDDTGLKNFTISGVIEDNRVHTADNYLLPSGDIQDPVAGLPGSDEGTDPGSTPGEPGDGTVPVASMWQEAYDALGFKVARLIFRNDGYGFASEWRTTDYGPDVAIPQWWLINPPWPTSSSVLYEMRAIVLSGPTPTGSPVNTWLNMATTTSWALSASGSGAQVETVIRFEIRYAPTGIYQATINVTMGAYNPI